MYYSIFFTYFRTQFILLMEIINCQKAHQEIIKLIQDFEDNFNHYTSPSYKEQEVREDFINKFWTALGWDVNHIHQKNPFQQEVKIEKGQRQNESNTQKRADYAFYLAPNYKKEVFFVEAKKPSRTLRKNKDDYFQTAKYGWNAGTGVSILTDFEEFVVIDCRFKPDFETILSNQIHYYDYKEFKEYDCFEKIYWLFSREAIAAGNLQTFVENLPKPKGKGKQLKLNTGNYQSIDESFLNYIDNIRKEMAQALHENCPTLDNYELTEATQRTIDRLVFMRFLEDKLIEPENILYNIATHPKPWDKFIAESKRLDAKYNGVVFKPLFIDQSNFEGANQDLFRAICQDLDHTNTPYDFNYFPIHILGNIYERFLGKTIIIENGKANIDLKPEVRKAGGVFYTPKYIVDYIIENTLGKLIYFNGISLAPSKVKEITLVDIACGSGSFLIGAFEYLLDYHNIYYNNHPSEAQKDGCKYDPETTKWILTIKQKQEILLNNIYGVDIDHQATEVTQLSLFLKMLEDETMTTANDMQVLFAQKILPDLSNNIKCGNSLIGTDILAEKLDLDLHEERKLNPFDFKYAFPKIFKNGGFDAIVGNPPYEIVFGKTKKERNTAELLQSDYLSKKYKTIEGELNLYKLFTERVKDLKNNNSYIGLIMPTNILNDKSTSKLRLHLLKNYNGFDIVEFPEKAKVFQNVTQAVCIYILKPTIGFNLKTNILNSDELKNISFLNITFNEIYNKIPIFKNQNEVNLFYKLEKNEKFKHNKNIVFSEGEIHLTKYNNCLEKSITNNTVFLLRGDSLYKYTYEIKSNKINQINIECLNNFSQSPKLKHNSLIRLAYQQVVNMQKIDRLNFCMVKDIYLGNTCGYMYLKNEKNIKYYLGLLNSNLLNWKYKLTSSNNHILTNELYELPIPVITKENQHLHDAIVTLVEQMLKAKEQEKNALSERDKEYLKRKCETLDTQINALVYEMYQLNEEDIKIIEKEIK
jgi:adenine-specific DNA-methyltransferase